MSIDEKYKKDEIGAFVRVMIDVNVVYLDLDKKFKIVAKPKFFAT